MITNALHAVKKSQKKKIIILISSVLNVKTQGQKTDQFTNELVVKIGNLIEQEVHTTRKENKMMETIQETLRTSQEQIEQNRLEVMEELKNQIKRLEEAYSHIEDARHEIRHAFIDSHDSDRNLVKKDFDEPLRKVLECSQNGLDNFIKILESEHEYIGKQIDGDYV